MRRLEEWNKLGSYHGVYPFIWSLFAQAGSLWDIWVHSNLLKNKCFEFHPKKFSEPTKQDWFGGIGRGRQASLDSIQI